MDNKNNNVAQISFDADRTTKVSVKKQVIVPQVGVQS